MDAGQRPEFGYWPSAHSDREVLPTFGAPEHVAYLVTELALRNRDRHESECSNIATLVVAAAKRVQVVAANTEVQERGLLKHARIAKSITAALCERGKDELTVRLGAEMAMLAFCVAFERWMTANDDEPFSPFAEAALSDLQARAAELVLPSKLSA
jgi:hypothetical protein